LGGKNGDRGGAFSMAGDHGYWKKKKAGVDKGIIGLGKGVEIGGIHSSKGGRGKMKKKKQ